MAGAVEHRQLFLHLGEGVVVEFLPDRGVVERGDVDGGLVFAAGDALEEVDLAGAAVEHAFEGRAVAQRPDDRRRLQAEDILEFIEQVDRAAGGPVALVHEREDGHAAAAADFEELAGLRLHALGGVDDHEGGVHGGEDAVGVLGEVLVAGGVEEVNGAAGVVELEDSGRDGDAALLLEFHPVGGGGALVFPGGDGAGQVQGVAVEQEFLGQSRLARIGVRDDRKGATAGDFLGGGHERRKEGRGRKGKGCVVRRAGQETGAGGQGEAKFHPAGPSMLCTLWRALATLAADSRSFLRYGDSVAQFTGWAA